MTTEAVIGSAGCVHQELGRSLLELLDEKAPALRTERKEFVSNFENRSRSLSQRRLHRFFYLSSVYAMPSVVTATPQNGTHRFESARGFSLTGSGKKEIVFEGPAAIFAHPFPEEP